MSDEISPDLVPAYILWVELATRVTVQHLHYRAGDEEAAAKSVYSLFDKTRKLLEDHPKAVSFRREALKVLDEVRPYTSRWHGWMVQDKSTNEVNLVFRDELVRRMFRTELRVLQKVLVGFKATLANLAASDDFESKSNRRAASLGAPLNAEIGTQIDIAPALGAPRGEINELINEAERREILERRRILSGEKSHGVEAPQKLVNAIGLALSGGGIRSATYCLGIVQVLVEKNLFPEIDYLSTVSGGGYFGTFLSCALGSSLQPQKKEEARRSPSLPASTAENPSKPNEASPKADVLQTRETILERIDDVFHRQHKGTESGLIRHLRNNSKYLLNGGTAAKFKIAGLLVSGIAWNLLMVLPIPVLAALTVYFLEYCLNFWGPPLEPRNKFPPATYWPASSSLAGQGLIWSLAAAAAGLFLLPLFEKLAHGAKPTSKIAMLRQLFIKLALILGAVAVLAAAVYIQPLLFYAYETLRVKLTTVTGHELVSSFSAPAAAGASSVLLGILATSLKSNWPRLKNVAAQLFILSGPLFFLLVYLMVGNLLGLSRSESFCGPWTLLGATVILLIWSVFIVNVNTMAPHLYYRARLCECYLARRPADPEKESSVKAMGKGLRRLLTGEIGGENAEMLQQVPLSSLGKNRAAPYHLINTTLNMPGSENKELRGRNGDFFVLSKYYCGAPIVGYIPTKTLEANDPHFDLGTAMAVSGAAASTSMGWKSLPNFRFIMTILNVRLGYWLRWNGSKFSPGVWYLLREMAASMNERCHLLNLSDGGHIENLGAYELLRRRCKFIICVDGGQEPGMECADLTRLQRYAEIDLGIEFQYGIADLSIQPNGFSRNSAILVKIIYPPTAEGESEARGWMVYIKLALIGIEPVYVLDYRRQNPTFPHESTADQIYDEAQFEAYRRLGECSAENLFRKELFGSAPTSIPNWFQGLADNLLADNDPVFESPQQSMAAAGSPVNLPQASEKPPTTT